MAKVIRGIVINGIGLRQAPVPSTVLINPLFLLPASLFALEAIFWDVNLLSFEALSLITGALADHLADIGTPPIDKDLILILSTVTIPSISDSTMIFS